VVWPALRFVAVSGSGYAYVRTICGRTGSSLSLRPYYFGDARCPMVPASYRRTAEGGSMT
jgi:hypothetical protein